MSQIAVFDSSALVKRYVPTELNFEAVTSLCADSENRVTISRLVGIEVASAFARRVTDRTLMPEVRDRAWAAFIQHVRDEYRVLAVDEVTCIRAEDLAVQLRIRALDAIHVATALLVVSMLDGDDSLTFYTADRRQAAAATAAGLEVEYLGDGV